MIPLAVAVAILVVAGVCAGIGWVLAHARSMPDGEIRAVVGPVQQSYAVDPATLHAALGFAIDTGDAELHSSYFKGESLRAVVAVAVGG